MSDLYKKSEWRTFRAELMELDGYRCKDCHRNSSEVILQVHHNKYILGRKPWQYALQDCETLCRGCHSARHGITKPQIGWEFIGEEDLGDLNGICENCGTAIRHCFLIQHEQWGTMEVGTFCCDKLTDSKIASNLIESQTSFKARKLTFMNSRRWKTENDKYLIKQSLFEVEITTQNRAYFIMIQGRQSKIKYDTLESAKEKVFDVIESGEFIEYLNKYNIPLPERKKRNRKKDLGNGAKKV
jgi:hypothetical protein